MNKSFRGELATAGVDHIRLSTKQGLVGYRIIKFQAVSTAPAAFSPEAILKLFRTPQTAGDGSKEFKILFNDPNLIGAIFYENNQNNVAEGQNVIIFDNETFNQDIYVTCGSTDGAINYYLELEQVKLDLNEATVATLKDMRGRE